MIQASLVFFLITTLICTLSPSYDLLLVARFMQGAAAAACRVIAVAIARDVASGRRMAEVMSMVMTAFMAVPVLAPTLGQIILTFAPWRWIFAFLMLFGAGLIAWLHFRLPETLHPEYRVPLKLRSLIAAFGETARHRLMVGYTLAAMPFFGGLYGFLGTSQQIFVDHFGLSDGHFPLAFAAIAGGIGLTSYANSRLVMRVGQRRLSHGALVAFAVISAVHSVVLLAGIDNLYLFLVLLAAAMAFLGLIAANFSALAMEPVGHVAGTASAAYGFLTGVVGALIGSAIGQMYDGTPVPLILAQAAMSALALALGLLDGARQAVCSGGRRRRGLAEPPLTGHSGKKGEVEMSFESIRYAVEDHVATITLHRPHRLNAFTLEMGDEIIAAFDAADADDEVRAVIVTGEPPAFCAGADLSTGADTFNRVADETQSGTFDDNDPKWRDRGGRVNLRIWQSAKPVIGAINGAAVGIGATMILPMDIRLASMEAKFAYPFAKRGIVWDGCASWFLPRVVGISTAMDWGLTGRTFTAAEAFENGLVARVLPAEDLLPEARERARLIVEKCSLRLRLPDAADGLAHDDGEQSDACAPGGDEGHPACRHGTGCQGGRDVLPGKARSGLPDARLRRHAALVSLLG